MCFVSQQRHLTSETRLRRRRKDFRLTSGSIGLLTGPHQTSFDDSSSFTIRLSDGDLPVFAPEYADSAPEEVIADPVSYTKASSYSAATDGLAIYTQSDRRSRNGEDLSYNCHPFVIDV